MLEIPLNVITSNVHKTGVSYKTVQPFCSDVVVQNVNVTSSPTCKIVCFRKQHYVSPVKCFMWKTSLFTAILQHDYRHCHHHHHHYHHYQHHQFQYHHHIITIITIIIKFTIIIIIIFIIIIIIIIIIITLSFNLQFFWHQKFVYHLRTWIHLCFV